MQNKAEHILKHDFVTKYPTITHGKGIYLYDTEGKEYIDGTSGAISSSLGHGRSDMAEALKDQATKLTYVYRHIASTEVFQLASDKLHEATGMDRFFSVSSGTEANEIATKIARLHFYHSGKPSKNKIIGRWQSYHGFSIDTLSYGGHVARRKEFMSSLREDGHVAPAYCYRCWFGKEEGNCNFECADALETEILERGPENIAAFISETVVGTALSAALPPLGYYKRVREICDKYHVLMIIDEVMCGAGRTGKMLAIEHYGVKPDIVSLAKSIGGGYFPVGIAACTDKVIEPIKEHGSFHPGHTWSGNPLAAAIIIKTLDIMKEENLMENVKVQGEYLKGRLEELKEKHATIGDVRGKGLMLGIEFVKSRETKEWFDPQISFSSKLAHKARNMGLLLMPTGGHIKGVAGDGIMLGPCFEVTREEIDKIVDILDRALAAIENELA